MNAGQQAAFARMLRLETAIRWTRDNVQREAYAAEWKQLQVIVDGGGK